VVQDAAGTPLAAVTNVSTYGDHVLARRQDASVVAWGRNKYGQLGDGTTLARPYASPVVSSAGAKLGSVRLVAAGYFFSMALHEDGTMSAWGCNDCGQLGNRMNARQYKANPWPVPVLVDQPHHPKVFQDVTSITTGFSTPAAITEAAGVRSVSVWGRQVRGPDHVSTGRPGPADLADMYISGSPEPVRLKEGLVPGGVAALASEYDLTFALIDPPIGEATAPLPLPAAPSAAPLPGHGPLWLVDLLSQYDRKGTARQSRRMRGGQELTDPVDLKVRGTATRTAVGDRHIAVIVDGKVLTLGWNHKGQLGDGTTEPRSTLKEVMGLPRAIDIAAAGFLTMALCDDGATTSLWRWGEGYLSPVRIDGLDSLGRLKSVSLSNHGVVLSESGQVATWGRNLYGELGTGHAAGSAMGVWPPLPVSLPMPAQSISSGDRHTLALLSDGTPWGWGNSRKGQLGVWTQEHEGITPRPLFSLTGIDQVEAAEGSYFLRGGELFATTGQGIVIDPAKDGTPKLRKIVGPPPITSFTTHGDRFGALCVDAGGFGTAWIWGSDLGPTPAPLRGLPSVKSVEAGSHGYLIVTEVRP
jgi:alpha-tubulin suppressor-like RCC1 family protein